MILDELRDAVQPLIDDDFDLAYRRFCDHAGTEDIGKFLVDLNQRGLLADDEISVIYEVYPNLSPAGTLAEKPATTTKAPRVQLGTPATTSTTRTGGSTGATGAGTDRGARPKRTTSRSTGSSRPRASGGGGRSKSPSQPTWSGEDGEANALPSGLRRAGKRTGGNTNAPATTGPVSSKVLVGRGYKIIGNVGEGAMGKVLLARDVDLSRNVAYKEMSPEIARKPVLAAKFYCEAQITAQLDHPNIVPIYALDEGGEGRIAYSMKLIRGKTLEDLIVECITAYDSGARTLDDEHDLVTRLDHFLKVCDAMHYAHSRGVVHRDLKPENIMIGPYGEVYVMDWGIAKVLERPSESDASATSWVELDEPPPEEGDVVIGTAQYMSPEQAEGRTSAITAASDQYALGLILYELVGLTNAVSGKSPMAIVLRQQEAQKDKLVHYAKKKVPVELIAIIDRATQRAPSDRYPDVRDLAEDVRRYLRGEAVHARPDRPLQALLRWVGHHRGATLFSIVALGTLFFMVTLGSWSFYLYEQTQNQAREERLSDVLSTVGTQSALVDGQFVRYEGLLGMIAARAVEKLQQPSDADAVLHPAAHFDAVTAEPDADPALTEALDLRDSDRYGLPVSLAAPLFAAADGLDVSRTRREALSLTALQPYQRNVLLRSHSDDAATWPTRRSERLLLDTGVPIAWIHIGLSDGLYDGYPGHGDVSERFDPRERPWYVLATGKDGNKIDRRLRGAQWGSPYVDPQGLGSILPSSTLLLDEHDRFLGVASVELTFDYVIDELLEAPTLAGRAEAFLLDDNGRVVVRSSQKSQTRSALGARTLRMPPFHLDEVTDLMLERGKQSGYLQTSVDGQDTLVVWQRMHSLGWYYVLEGSADTLLGG